MAKKKPTTPRTPKFWNEDMTASLEAINRVEGKLDDFPWNHPRVTVVCSPKTHVNARVFPNVHHWKYVIDHRHVDEKTGLPTQVLGLYVPGIYSEIDPSRIWISPMDEQNEVANALNRQACVKSALRFGYRISLQTHKLLGVE